MAKAKFTKKPEKTKKGSRKSRARFSMFQPLNLKGKNGLEMDQRPRERSLADANALEEKTLEIKQNRIGSIPRKSVISKIKLKRKHLKVKLSPDDSVSSKTKLYGKSSPQLESNIGG
jgi:hypothetical protein